MLAQVIFVHPNYLPGPQVPGLPPFAADFLLDTVRAATLFVSRPFLSPSQSLSSCEDNECMCLQHQSLADRHEWFQFEMVPALSNPGDKHSLCPRAPSFTLQLQLVSSFFKSAARGQYQ